MSDETVSKSDPRRVGQGRLSSGDTMLAQFLSMIEVRVKLIESAITSEADRAILREVRESLIDFDAILINDVTEWRAAAWNEAYRLERLLALVEPAPGLLSELQRRLDEASDENVIAVARLQKRVELAALVEQNSSPPALKQGTEDTARRLLLNIIEEIQWVLQKKFQSRFIRKVAAYKIAWFALGAFALFCSSLRVDLCPRTVDRGAHSEIMGRTPAMDSIERRAIWCFFQPVNVHSNTLERNKSR
jgi:hypothetical protein